MTCILRPKNDYLLNVTTTRILSGIAGLPCVRCGHDRDFVLALGCSGYEHLSWAALFSYRDTPNYQAQSRFRSSCKRSAAMPQTMFCLLELARLHCTGTPGQAVICRRAVTWHLDSSVLRPWNEGKGLRSSLCRQSQMVLGAFRKACRQVCWPLQWSGSVAADLRTSTLAAGQGKGSGEGGQEALLPQEGGQAQGGAGSPVRRAAEGGAAG